MLAKALSQTLWHLAADGFLLVTLADAGPFTHGVRWRRCLVVFANQLDPSPAEIRAWVKIWSAQRLAGVQQILVAGFGPAQGEPGYLALDLTHQSVTGKAPRGLVKGLRRALARFDPQVNADFPRLERLQAETEVALTRLRSRQPWVTYATIVACAAMYALTLATGGPDNNWTMFRWGADYPPAERAGQIWRWGSAMYLHFSWLHIGLNMFSLYVLGRTLERVLGARQFAGLYAAGGLAGGAASLLTAPANGLSAGASGAIFGLFGAGLWMELKGHPQLPGPLRKGLVGGMGPVILANLAIGFSTSFINNAAHLGGLAGGLLFMASRLRGWPAAALGLIPPLALGWALVQGIPEGSVYQRFLSNWSPQRSAHSPWPKYMPQTARMKSAPAISCGPTGPSTRTVVTSVLALKLMTTRALSGTGSGKAEIIWSMRGSPTRPFSLRRILSPSATRFLGASRNSVQVSRLSTSAVWMAFFHLADGTSRISWVKS